MTTAPGRWQGSRASSQPLASQVGLEILRQGGNAADAAVGVAAALNVTEPCSTGIGGDCFCLFYHAGKKQVLGLNASGRCPAGLNINVLAEQGITDKLPWFSPHAITVPGAAAGWVDTVEKFGSGKLDLGQILQPAIELAEYGFPVHPVAAHHWQVGAPLLTNPKNRFGYEMLLNGKPPKAGEIMKMPNLARTFRELATQGKNGFYSGRIANAIVDIVKEHGGLMTLDDLSSHYNTFDDPICVNYKGINVWEIPPNGQGITALLALNLLKGYDWNGIEHNSTQYLHTLIEAMRISFADSSWYVADPEQVNIPIKELLSNRYANERRQLIKSDRATVSVEKGKPFNCSDTVYFATADNEGNACSFINSNYMGFGTGIIPEGCGFTLQNRGSNFSLEKDHPNILAPRKRPYHTIIPGMATCASSGDLYASFGVMGGFMQPQGHVQVMLNMIDFDMNPQQALDAARFCVGSGHKGSAGGVNLEKGLPCDTRDNLADMGHDVSDLIEGHGRALFGRGQIILRKEDGNGCRTWWAGSDPRADGLAIGY
ncbi:uncharacterized protein TRIADDRAFT_62141 [Trichoplax adhaerens]|uniref:Gamma-glutamyltransferase n=1 Tax=Trichoplax adhaerens TaxID=10228 RepID=B3SCY5_TRIAD|nr:hypothetical protein TRIADDRAFT_62141 [Trichoplax adhaerens]EDV19401.1 hypothetical protein TRIADDRAFT_62141 [Trichoplax adhaerens]|eukprot:XP_002118090.1 hypothetical protein TRIADDRAFT_62141 [Trichoplax adhaerens]